MTLAEVLMIIAFILAVLAAAGMKAGRVSLGWAAFAVFVFAVGVLPQVH